MQTSELSVALRPLGLRDADVIAGWAADLRWCEEAGWPLGLQSAERVRFHRNLIEFPPADLIRLGAIHQHRLIGYVDLHGSQTDRREIGFVIGERRRWGRGLGRLAAAAGLDHGFTQLRLREIWAEALDANQRSVRILQSLGLVETGRGDDGLFIGHPTYYRQFSITGDAWARLGTD